MTLARLVAYLKASLWFVPVVCVVVGGLLSYATISIDRAFGYQAIPSRLIGDPDAVIAILSTVAASMVSLTALVLTITMVVVQLAMGQFSPRIVQRILRDKPSQLAIGLFVATFVHSILAVREVSDDPTDAHVPGIAVVTAFVLVLISIAVLVLYVHHIGLALRVSSLIELVGNETRKLIDRTYPLSDRPVDASTPADVRARDSGVITSIGTRQLVREAERAGCVLELVPALGEFVPAGATLFRVTGSSADLDEDSVRRAVVVDEERNLDEDVAYGLRLLVDIAERSVSSSAADPTTAVQAIDRLHDVLRQLVLRDIPDGRHFDAAGELRLVIPAMSWNAYVQLAFDEIRLGGSGSPQVSRRLIAALTDLLAIAPPDRKPILEYELALIRDTAPDRFADQRDTEMSLEGDKAGIGQSVDGNGRGVHSVNARNPVR
jgi:uncharacterized membrane protein